MGCHGYLHGAQYKEYILKFQHFLKKKSCTHGVSVVNVFELKCVPFYHKVLVLLLTSGSKLRLLLKNNIFHE